MGLLLEVWTLTELVEMLVTEVLEVARSLSPCSALIRVRRAICRRIPSPAPGAQGFNDIGLQKQLPEVVGCVHVLEQ